MRKLLVIVTACVVVLTQASSLFAVESGRAAGKFVVNGKARPVKFAYAQQVKNEEGGVEYHVVVSDRALFPSTLAAEHKWSDFVESSGGGLAKFVFAPDKTLQQVHIQDSALSMSGFTMGASEMTATVTELSAGNISARMKSDEEHEFFDDVVAFDLSFSASVGDGEYGENRAARKELEPKFAKLAEGAASGSLVVAGERAQLSHVYAVTAPGMFDESKRDTIVILSDKPISDALLADARKLSSEAQRGAFQGVIIRLDEESQPYSSDIYHYAGQSSMSGSGFLGFEALQFDGKAAVGRLFTPKEQRLVGEKSYSFDALFRATVRTLDPPREEGLVDAKNGTRLPAGGGEPGKAYLAFDKAVAKGDLNQLKKFAPEDGGGLPPLDPSDPETKQMLELLKAMQPKNIRITEGWVAGDLATLTVVAEESVDGMKSTSTGTIFMKREAGTWRVGKQSWKTVAK